MNRYIHSSIVTFLTGVTIYLGENLDKITVNAGQTALKAVIVGALIAGIRALIKAGYELAMRISMRVEELEDVLLEQEDVPIGEESKVIYPEPDPNEPASGSDQ